ncbi:MAG: glucosyl-3-phosphoglycerate synthase [Pseudonocardiaceae bacterium]
MGLIEELDGAVGLADGVREWLARRTSCATDWSAEHLAAAKGGATVSVVIPARNEEATIGAIVTTIRGYLMERVALVDEVLVVDSRSVDGTAAVAAATGARVVAQDEVLSELPRRDGKGDVLWKGLAASSGELVVFVDADLRGFTPDFVTGLLGPLLTDPAVDFVKAFYQRPFELLGLTVPDGGGRVTELVARPLLNLYWPTLAGFVQPLAGEYAGRRAVLERVPFVTGYGVELGLLVDLLELVGLDAMAQVNLGQRRHTHQGNDALGRMAAQIMLTAASRLQREGRIVASAPPATMLAQFRRRSAGGGAERELVVSDVAVPERPSLATLRAAPVVGSSMVGP